MRSNSTNRTTSNVNVTLERAPDFAGRTFPCPVCMTQLELRQSRARKPYCVCNWCGIQLFFRGQKAIARLGELGQSDGIPPVRLEFSGPAEAFSHLERLRSHKSELQDKLPLIFSDRDLENAILALQIEIARTQKVLEGFAHAGRATERGQ